MLTYSYSPSGSFLDDRTGDLVTLRQIRNQIVAGQSIRVLQYHSKEDVTQDILLKVISLESRDCGDTVFFNKELEAFVRRMVHKRKKPKKLDEQVLQEEAVVAWFMRMQVRYVNTWAKDFGRRYMSLEYMLLISNTFIYHWLGQTLGVATATQSMRHGARRTRTQRLLNLIDEGWLSKVQDRIDRRKVAIVPTPKFEEQVQAHVTQMLTNALIAIPDSLGLQGQVSSILATMRESPREEVQRRYLVAYLEFVVWSCESWDRFLYGYEFFDIDVAELCTHAVVSHLIDKPLTVDKLRELMPFISSRILKSRIEQCVESKLLIKSKHPEDKRVSVFSPTSVLNTHLTAHFSRLLSRFIAIVEELSST